MRSFVRSHDGVKLLHISGDKMINVFPFGSFVLCFMMGIFGFQILGSLVNIVSMKIGERSLLGLVPGFDLVKRNGGGVGDCFDVG